MEQFAGLRLATVLKMILIADDSVMFKKPSGQNISVTNLLTLLKVVKTLSQSSLISYWLDHEDKSVLSTCFGSAKVLRVHIL